MKIIIDRIEDCYAVCETSEGSLLLHSSDLPEGAKSGDILKNTPQGYVILNKETERRRKRIFEKIKRLTGDCK